jgi:hypothetical protein
VKHYVTMHTADGRRYEVEYGDEGFAFMSFGSNPAAFIETMGGDHIATSSVVRIEGLKAIEKAAKVTVDEYHPAGPPAQPGSDGQYHFEPPVSGDEGPPPSECTCGITDPGRFGHRAGCAAVQ